MNLEELVNKKDDLLTANDREMLTAVFRDRQAVGKMNSTELAAFLHVSRTTLVRLMKKLDVDTYAEFKLLLDRKEDAPVYRYDLLEIIEKYHLMIDELTKYNYEKICEAIHQAGTIYLYGTGNEQKTIAEEFKRIFLMLGKCCVDLYDLGEVEFAKNRFQDRDLFVAVSLSGENSEALNVVKAVQKMGIGTVSFTRWANNSLARLCRENLYVGTKTVNPSSGQSYEMVAAFYILLDILSVRYLEYADRMEKEAQDEN
ncbi:MurR/RpiR family transcriptional regulator [Clostridium sp. AM58-1XD]|uniref:MurR/RpiR family transcriptional regulator n=1 Tax=Clostridium sp. AM58-1XD TaxID=2292307 RepID=UPI000E518DFA|nr:MurR/RpiR family transcriptional regulator [Clostridium sp. AM58-1XD]RGY95999.1 MurR/RpiR family transcriptional regulator [Clostridium sp. AM58-1XD]